MELFFKWLGCITVCLFAGFIVGFTVAMREGQRLIDIAVDDIRREYEDTKW
jgi:uncharacterized protein YneF (UPF0154 family)